MANAREREDEADRAWERMVKSVGLALLALGSWGQTPATRGVDMVELRFKLKADEGSSVLLILKATIDGEAKIAFEGGLDVGTVTQAARKKLQAGATRWREDKPWGG